MIEATDLTLMRGRRLAVHGVSLRLAARRLTVVVGPNGAGKSSLLKLLTGELRPDGGRITYDGRDLADLKPAQLARLRAVLPQSPALAFPFTVHEVVRLGATASGERQIDRIAGEALDKVGLAGFGGRLYGELSGGEQARVQFARALAQVPRALADGIPRTLFLDEPTASLDFRHQISVLEGARDFARAGGAVFAVLHDLNLAAEFADEILVLDAGRLVAHGAPSEALYERTLNDVFGICGAACNRPTDGLAYFLPQVRNGSRFSAPV